MKTTYIHADGTTTLESDDGREIGRVDLCVADDICDAVEFRDRYGLGVIGDMERTSREAAERIMELEDKDAWEIGEMGRQIAELKKENANLRKKVHDRHEK